MTHIIIISVAIVAMIALVIIGHYLYPRREKAAGRKCTSADAWDAYVATPGKRSARDREAIARLPQAGEETVGRLKQSIRETVERCQAAAKPLATLRQAIMDATDQFVLAETVFDAKQEAAPAEHFENVIEAGVLRRFSGLCYDDVDKQDWYTHYLKMAEMNSKNVAAMLKKTLEGDHGSMEASLHDPLTRTMSDVRKVLLDYPCRTPVQRADKLLEGEGPTRLSPSRKQVDRLTRTMTVRFEKLFAGQVYQSDHGQAVNPVGAFQVDAGLLYTLLSLSFRYPTDAWREVMSEALGPYRKALEEDEEKLLRIAQESHRAWLKDEKEGPLNAVLQTACAVAFEDADPNVLAGSMMEDAAVLVSSIKEIIEEK